MSAVKELEDYIKENEGKHGGILVKKLDARPPLEFEKLFRSLGRAVEKRKAEKIRAYRNIKDSNETLKLALDNLRCETDNYDEEIARNCQKIEAMNTARLLNIKIATNISPRDN